MFSGMEQEPRRRRTLTPLSGELRAPVAWTPADPTRKERRRKAKAPPTTRGGVLLHGLARFALLLGSLIGGVALIATLIVWLGGASSGRVFPIAFYIAGALLGSAAFFGGTGTYAPEYWDRGERERAFNMTFVYGVFAVILIGIGVLLESVV
jgi:hypothetical protein